MRRFSSSSSSWQSLLSLRHPSSLSVLSSSPGRSLHLSSPFRRPPSPFSFSSPSPPSLSPFLSLRPLSTTPSPPPSPFLKIGKRVAWVLSLVVIGGGLAYGRMLWEWREYPKGVREWMREGIKARNGREWGRAEECFLEAIRLTIEDPSATDPTSKSLRIAHLRIKLAEVYFQSSQLEKSGEQFSLCYTTFLKANQTEKALAMILEILPILEQLDLYDASADFLHGALKLGEEKHLPPEKMGPFHEKLGEVFHQLGREKEALVHYKMALEIAEGERGKDHCEISLILNNMAGLAPRALEEKEALKILQRGFEIAQGKCHEMLPLSHFNLAKALSNTSPESSRLHLKKARELATKSHDVTLLKELDYYEKKAIPPAPSSAWISS